jgi:hypothetical protein
MEKMEKMEIKKYKHKQSGKVAIEYSNEFYKIDTNLIPKYLIEKTNDWELIKEKLEFNRWVVDDNYPNFLGYYTIDIFYGIHGNNYWFFINYDCNPNNSANNRYATDAEVLNKLSTYATKLGYKEGVKVKSLVFSGFNFKIGSKEFEVIGNSLLLGGTCIMRNGAWATIIKEESHFTPEQLLEIKELIINNK